MLSECRPNPFTLEAAELVEWGYRYFGDRRSTPEPPEPPGWTIENTRWSNVQLVIASRPLAAPEHMSVDEAGVELVNCRAAALPERRLVAAIVPGTNELTDWLSNFGFWPRRVGGLPGRWRAGFMQGAEWVWSELRRRARPSDRMLIAGHSYGAAMATCAAGLAARDLVADRVLGVIAFAPPRTTTKAGAAYLAEHFGGGRGQRVSLGFDVVPWAVLPVGWRHALEPIYVGCDGVMRRTYRLWAELRHALATRGLQAIGDHSMARYLAWARGLAADKER